jgi:hypothetical protein
MSGPARLRLCLQHAGDQLPKSIQEDGYEITFQQVGNGSRGKRRLSTRDGKGAARSRRRAHFLQFLGPEVKERAFRMLPIRSPSSDVAEARLITGFSELLAFASPTAPVVRVEPLPENAPASQDRATLAVIFLVEHLWPRNSAGIFIRLCVLRRRRASPVECRSD